MPVKPLPRTPAGSLAKPSRIAERYSIDFTTATPSRTVSDAVGASGATSLTSALKLFRESDIGSFVYATGIGNSARITAVATDGGTATLSTANSAAVNGTATLTSLPQWLTITTTWPTSQISIAGGKATLTCDPNASSTVQLLGPAVTLSSVAFIDVTVIGLELPTSAAQVYIGVAGSLTNILTNTGEGGFLFHGQGRTDLALRASVSETVTNPDYAENGFTRAAVTVDVTFRIDVASKMIYAIMDGQDVQGARDLSSVMVTTGTQRAIFAARGNSGTVKCRGIEMVHYYR